MYISDQGSNPQMDKGVFSKPFEKPVFYDNFLFFGLGISDLHNTPGFNSDWSITLIKWDLVTNM